MVMRYRRLFEASKVLSGIISAFSGEIYSKQFPSAFGLLASSLPPSHGLRGSNGIAKPRLCHLCRYSTIPQVLNDQVCDADLISFIKYAFDELEGTNHYWLNTAEETKYFLHRNKFPVILVGLLPNTFLSSECRSVIEKLKSIQQRCPNLFVMGFLCGSDSSSQVYQTHLAELIIKEYINFPILLVNKHYSEMSNEHTYILLRGSRKPELYHEGELDNEVLDKAMEEASQSNDEWHKLFDNSSWVVSRQNNAAREPYLCSLMQNMLLSSQGCISADEEGRRLFISDSNHHRIIVSTGGGEIVDCIGSSPGFEDGDFDSAKLLCPASSIYCDDEDCLYFVDSENHAIRRADMGKRVVDTIYPKSHTDKKTNSLWSWIKNSLGYESNVVEPEISNTQLLIFPWHLIQSKDDKLYIINRSFETLWVLHLGSGEIEQTIKGHRAILETCEELIDEKISLLKQIPTDLLHHQALANLPPGDKQYTNLLSSFTTLGKNTVIYDTAGHSVLKFCRESGVVSSLKFSNFANLGLPYWFSSSLEKVYTINSANGSRGASNFHVKRFILLPGRVDIQLNVDIPIDTELVEPLKDSNIWRQTRGSATEVSGSNNVGITEKVGVAQQWYDELDSLAFEEAEPESLVGEDEKDDNNSTETSIADRKVQITSSVNTSPGTSEVIIFAGLYLKLKSESGSKEETRENYAKRLAELLVLEGSGESEKDFCYRILLKSKTNLSDLIFTKPLHIRIRLDSRDHAKGDNSKDILLSDSSIKFDLSF